jgi:hypothetical protein
MKFELMADIAKLVKVRNHLRNPVPADWAIWLLKQHMLQNAIAVRALEAVTVPDGPFDDLTSQEKLARIYRELESIKASENKGQTLPASWTAWLLAEFEKGPPVSQ